MRKSSAVSRPQQKARSTCSTSPQRCCRTRTPNCCRARSNGCETAAQSSTSTESSATLRAKASGDSTPRTNSRRSVSFPRRRVMTSRRAAVSRTGEMRCWQMGTPMVTTAGMGAFRVPRPIRRAGRGGAPPPTWSSASVAASTVARSFDLPADCPSKAPVPPEQPPRGGSLSRPLVGFSGLLGSAPTVLRRAVRPPVGGRRSRRQSGPCTARGDCRTGRTTAAPGDCGVPRRAGVSCRRPRPGAVRRAGPR